MDKSILVVLLHSDNIAYQACWEALGAASVLRGITGYRVVGLVLGLGIVSLAEEIAGQAGIEVIAIEDENLARYSAEGYVSALAEVCALQHPAIVCVPHTPVGYDFAARLAVRLHAACITGVEQVRSEHRVPIFTRSLQNGKIRADVRSDREVTVVSLQAGAFGFEKRDHAQGGFVTRIGVAVRLESTSGMRTLKKSARDTTLDRAETVVAAGRGIGSLDNVRLIEDCASLFVNSAIGGSRAACDQAYLDPALQIGMTGKTVSPKLYIACGISGSIQHICGMKNARFIVAVNRDPKAAIFQVADVCIVEDLTKFIPVFVEAARLGHAGAIVADSTTPAASDG